ncbi:MAG TPA: Sec-independent protein translocase subunit TatA [Actinotalea sp.]|nr:Sec-independent protein translocase subunit TatA [Actinotalea sp.]
MGNLRGWEWLILLAIVLLLFGARRLPDLARSVGKSMKIFRSEVKDVGDAPADTPSTTATDDDGERPRP